MEEAADLRMRFGRLVAAHRKRQGMTQSVLAEASGLSPDMIARVETGGSGVRFPNIQRLATALKVDASELFAPDVPKSALRRPAFVDLVSKLSSLSDNDLVWIAKVIDAALLGRRNS